MGILKKFLIKNKKTRGFTLLEILLVIAIITILSAVIIPISQTVFTQSSLDIATHNLQSDLYRAYTYAREGKNDSAWGVNIVDHKVTFFATNSADFNETSEIQPSITINSVLLNDHKIQVVFAKGTGLPDIPDDVDTIVLTSLQGISKTIAINNLGFISFYNNSYTLAYIADSNGTIDGISPQTVAYGASGTPVTAIPNENYHFTQWTDFSTDNPRTDSNVIADISVTANFDLNQLILNYIADANGSILPAYSASQSIVYGNDASQVTAMADTGYHFTHWDSDNNATQNPRTDTNIISSATHTAYFDINYYSLNYTASSHGSISGNASQSKAYNSSGDQVTAVADSNYHFSYWDDGYPSNPRTDNPITHNISAVAHFAINQITLTYTAGIGGSLNNGNNTQTQTVNYGGNGTAVTAVPSGGYYFTGWSDGNLSNPRTDLNVTSNLSVTANFSNQYTLVYTAGSGGTLSGSASQIVIYNGNGTAITAVPNSGYHFVNWSDGSTSNPRTDTGIHANLSVTANFTTTQFTLTYTAGSNGTLNGGSPQTQTINQGSNGSPVTAVANSGYHFVNWSDLSTANPRTDTNVQGNISVTARFTVDCGDSFVDARDSNSYPIVSIGFQCWMAKNLAYLPSVSPSASGNDTDPYYYVYNYDYDYLIIPSYQ